jgi:hypothetical protein
LYFRILSDSFILFSFFLLLLITIINIIIIVIICAVSCLVWRFLCIPVVFVFNISELALY